MVVSTAWMRAPGRCFDLTLVQLPTWQGRKLDPLGRWAYEDGHGHLAIINGNHHQPSLASLLQKNQPELIIIINFPSLVSYLRFIGEVFQGAPSS